MRYMIFKLCLFFGGAALALVGSASVHAASWDELIAAGKKDGSVIVAGPSFAHFRDWIVKTFQADTGIKVEWKPLVGGPGPFTASLLREADANKISTDVYIGGTTSCFNFTRKPKVVANLKDIVSLPDVLDSSKWRGGGLRVQTGTDQQRDDNDFWCFIQTADWVMGDLFVNTKLIDPKSITSWNDLLDPKYKGKILAHDPRRPGAGQATAAYLYSKFGQDFVKKLYVGQEAAFGTSYGKNPEAVATGKYAIGIAFVQAAVERYRKKGLPIERVFPKDGMGLATGGFSGIAALNGPNKNARATFVNWFLTKKTQETVQCLLLEQSIRTDLDSYDCIPEYVRPKPGVEYPIHDYEKRHHFGAKSELRRNVTTIFGK